ncbi:Alpha/beta hydrolase [Candidatus Hodgkinia cicadicola]|uniref:Alpha/beta hydrolase n=1 Tax=Candidatus Hodgkinia cicadicola TaxID=573658 RepID=A0ABX4MH93_9HYPH|nr:Alpha/beta hydrolase [Candidatus Hodgkinia cicadicola]
MLLNFQVFDIIYQLSYYSIDEVSQVVYIIDSEFNGINNIDIVNNLIFLLSKFRLNIISQKIYINKIGKFILHKDNLIGTELTMNWILERHNHENGIMVIGISFAACIAAELIIRRPEISEYLLISPPIRYYDLEPLTKINVPGIVVFSDYDIYIPLSRIYKLHNNTKKNLICNLKLILIRNTDSSYKNKFNVLNKIFIDIYIKYKIKGIYRNSINL